MTDVKLREIEPSLGQGQGTSLVVTAPSANAYTLEVTSKVGANQKFKISETDGVATRTCTTGGKGACPSSLSW